MFPLSTVVFPGVSLPLHVFEDRYRSLVRHLLTVDDPAERVFGTVAIREGYEVGDHGSQSLYRVGVRLQLTEVERQRRRHLRDRGRRPRAAGCSSEMQRGEEFAHGVVDVMDEPEGQVPDRGARPGPGDLHRVPRRDHRAPGHPFSGSLPRDPDYLSWTLAALAPLPDGRAAVAARGRLAATSGSSW